ncbi:DNA polymerase alpha/epsilon subunit B domain-containing protein [Phthorimaea operculella]|nr:DNA polymerase alpha/epsilon subunit B domain-containing protein [Phthorimaea operculella]
MASEESVTEQFQLLGIEVSGEVLAKCVRLCEEYDVDAETFTEQWMAFSLTNLNGAAPDLENLDVLARKEFSKRAASRPTAPAKDAVRSTTGSSLKVYGAPVSTQPDNDVLSNYMATTPKGTVVLSYGDEKLLEAVGKPNAPTDTLNLSITQVPNEDGDLYTKAKIGFELLHEKASTYDNHIRYVSQCIMKKADIKETVSVRHKTQTEVYVCGRIECDADARLNSKCVVLQGTWQDSLSQAVPVDIDNVKQYSLFPGQVVVARGTNPRGDRFLAQEILTDAARPTPDHAQDIIHTLRGTMSLVVAAGPYTTSDNLAFEPLKDLVAYITQQRPHVVLLTGPFLDADHAKVKDNSMAETYKAFFEKLVDSLGELSTSCPFTKIYIASSQRDAFHINIYPTPPYSTRRKHPNIHFIPDPSTLNINGVLVGVTSTDVLMHLSQEEISLGCGGDKLARLAGHLISQQCYYPLCGGASAGAGAGHACPAVDAALWAAHAQLQHTPHLLVLPGHFRCFLKVRTSGITNKEDPDQCKTQEGAGVGYACPAVDAALWAAHAQLPSTPHLLVLPGHFRCFLKVRTKGARAGHACPAVDAALWAAHAQLPHTPHLLVLPGHFRCFLKVRYTLKKEPGRATRVQRWTRRCGRRMRSCQTRRTCSCCPDTSAASSRSWGGPRVSSGGRGAVGGARATAKHAAPARAARTLPLLPQGKTQEGAGAGHACPAVDAALWAAHAQLPSTPHLLVLPGHFRCFLKEVADSVVVNPERLSKGMGGGTFARLLLRNDQENKLTVAGQIVRI